MTLIVQVGYMLATVFGIAWGLGAFTKPKPEPEPDAYNRARLREWLATYDPWMLAA